MKSHATSLPPPGYRAILFRYLAPHRGSVAALGSCIAVGIGLQLVNPQIMKRFIDAAQSDEPMRVLFVMAGLFMAVAVAQQIVGVASVYLGENIAWRSTNALRRDLAGHCLSLDLEFHNAHSPGEMIERIDGDVSAVATFFSQFAVQVVGNVLLLLGIIALMLATDLRVGVPMAVVMLLSLLVVARLQSFGAALWEKAREAEARLFGYLEERLAGTEDIRSLGAREYVLRGFYRCSRAVIATRTRAGTLGAGVTHNVSFLLSHLGTAAVMAIGAYLFFAGRISLGTVYLLYHYAGMVARPISTLAHQMQELQQAGAGLARIRRLRERTSRIEEPPAPLPPPAGTALGVTFSEVSFAYERGREADAAESGRADGQGAVALDGGFGSKGRSVLERLSFTLEPGRALGLLGRTGSGKTTVTRLIYRFYDPDEGTIRLVGGAEERDIRSLDLGELRSRIGMVTQNVQLYQASLRDNVTFFDPSVPDRRIRDVLEGLGLERWLTGLPNGLDAPIRESSLSAGEAQLVAFARVFLRNPPIVVLDEASSRLDPATELLVERAVAALLRGRTALVIAHRLRTVKRVDDILILSDGKCAEHGCRESLAADGASLFARLLEGDSGGLLAEVLA